MKWIVLMAILITLFALVAFVVGHDQNKNTIYDPNPNHLWNRLNKTLFVRTARDGKKYGSDELDILYWYRTENLLAEPSHQQALAIFDEFINTHGEKLIHDPLKRALLQRDLWELFDWSADPIPFYRAQFPKERRELQSRLAMVIRRLALTTNEIAALPDNYAQAETKKMPDLPSGLFQTNSDWVSVGDDNDVLTTPTHVAAFNGHSVFCVMLHMPGGRQAAISYLDKLRLFEPIWIYQTNTDSFHRRNAPREILTLNPDIPQFPTNTEWALVRRMLAIDADGNIQSTPIVESIQVRRYFAFTTPTVLMLTNRNGFVVPVPVPPQNFYEFQMNRRQNGELREVANDERDFTAMQVLSMGIDPFESSFRDSSGHEQPPPDSLKFQREELKTCFECHMAPGIFSVNSYTRALSSSLQQPADLTPRDIDREATETIYWKQHQFNWGLLQGLWPQEN